MVECGCPYVPPKRTGCKICADDNEHETNSNSNKSGDTFGLVPEPMRRVDPTDAFTSCGVYEWEYSISSVSKDECSAVRDRIAFACKCGQKMVGRMLHYQQADMVPGELDVKEIIDVFAAALVIVVVTGTMLLIVVVAGIVVATTEGKGRSVQSVRLDHLESSADCIRMNSSCHAFRRLSTIYETEEEEAEDDMEDILI